MANTAQIAAELAVAEHRLKEAGKYPAYLLVAVWGVACAIFFFIDSNDGWGGAFAALAVGSGWKAWDKFGEIRHLKPQVERLGSDYQESLRRDASL